MRLINADALDVVGTIIPKDADTKSYVMGMEYILNKIDSMPTIEERKTGKWIEVEVFPDSYDIYGNKTWSSEMQCDQCGFRHTAIEGHMAQYNFCPNCGADMRGEQDALN